MSVITLNGKNVDLSLATDALTVYFNFATPDLFSAWNLCARSLHLNKEWGLCCREVKMVSEFDRFIHTEDDDHRLYHQDQFSDEKMHSHIKLLTPLTKNKLELLLSELEKHQLISSEEKSVFLVQYDERNKKALHQLRSTLPGSRDPEVDAREIIKFISSCKDNEVIAYLHQALLETRFDYLRVITSTSLDKLWQGTDASGKLVETSKHWAMIQKAISLQMAENVRAKCGTFSGKVAHERASQLKGVYPFFALKRKSPICTTQLSSTYKAFDGKDEATFTAKYAKHFAKFQ